MSINSVKLPNQEPTVLLSVAHQDSKSYGQVIANFEPTSSYSHCGPLQVVDNFRCTAQFMGYADIFRSAQVCKQWNAFSKDPFIWQQFFKNEKIPFVESVNGQGRDYKQDFRILHPITISGRMIERLFGEMIGEIPCISVQRFNQLLQEDPFGKEGKTMGQTFVFVVVPHLIRRTSGKEFPYVLDEESDLIYDSLTVQELMIPFSARNLKVLCSYPLAGQENMPVIDANADAVAQLFNKAKPCANKVSVYFMRRDICCRTMFYPAQKRDVEERGFEVTSLSVRGLFDAVCILTFGTCPDAQDPRSSIARTSDSIRFGDNIYQSCIGGFAPGAGASVDINRYVSDNVGVVPSASAEAPRTLVLGALGLDKGH